MSRPNSLISFRAVPGTAAAALTTAALCAVAAPSEGGLYIAGAGFTFQQALAKNPGGQRFFLLAIPPETRAVMTTASAQRAATRDRVVAAGGVLMVCQRDIDNGKIAASSLAPGVVAVRGWTRVRTDDMPLGARYFKGEDPSNLPASNNALRQLRSTCAS
jgi:hypothetical protein